MDPPPAPAPAPAPAQKTPPSGALWSLRALVCERIVVALLSGDIGRAGYLAHAYELESADEAGRGDLVDRVVRSVLATDPELSSVVDDLERFRAKPSTVPTG